MKKFIILSVSCVFLLLIGSFYFVQLTQAQSNEVSVDRNAAIGRCLTYEMARVKQEAPKWDEKAEAYFKGIFTQACPQFVKCRTDFDSEENVGKIPKGYSITGNGRPGTKLDSTGNGVACPCLEGYSESNGFCVRTSCDKGQELVDGKCAEIAGGEEEGPNVVDYVPQKMTIKSIEGDVQVQPKGKAELQAMLNVQLKPGDEIFSGYNSRVILETERGDLIVLRSNTQVHILEHAPLKLKLKLNEGEIKAKIKVTGPRRPDVRIETPTATTSVRGTEFVIAVAKDGKSDILVTEGTVAVTNNKTGQEASVPAGQKISVDTDSLGALDSLTKADIAKFSDSKNPSKGAFPFYYIYIGIAALFIIGVCALLISKKRKG